MIEQGSLKSGSITLKVTDSTGAVINPATEETLQTIVDPLAKYKGANIDVSADPFYFGNIALDGSWYIEKLSLSGNTDLFSKGSNSYGTAWTGRAGLSYDYYNIIFN